jgi:hypothetical protein
LRSASRAATGETVRLRRIQHPNRGAQIAVMARKISRFDDAIRKLPSSTRYWDNSSQIWFVNIDLERTLVEYCKRFFDVVVWDDSICKAFETAAKAQKKEPPKASPPPPKQKQSNPPPPSFEDVFGQSFFGKRATHTPPAAAKDRDFFSRKHATAHDYKTLQVDQDACEEVVKAAYRALSLKYHPDRGGNADRLAAVNVAFERIGRGGK